MPNDKQSKPPLTFREAVDNTMARFSTGQLSINVGTGVVRCVHATYSLARKRCTYYSDERRLTVATTASHVAQLAFAVFDVTTSGSQLYQRLSQTQPTSTQPPKQVLRKNEGMLMAVRMVLLTIVLDEAVKGRTRIKKRPLSRSGRANDLLAAATAAYAIGESLRNIRN